MDAADVADRFMLEAAGRRLAITRRPIISIWARPGARRWQRSRCRMPRPIRRLRRPHHPRRRSALIASWFSRRCQRVARMRAPDGRNSARAEMTGSASSGDARSARLTMRFRGSSRSIATRCASHDAACGVTRPASRPPWRSFRKTRRHRRVPGPGGPVHRAGLRRRRPECAISPPSPRRG
jgi:hypothetical protein